MAKSLDLHSYKVLRYYLIGTKWYNVIESTISSLVWKTFQKSGLKSMDFTNVATQWLDMFYTDIVNPQVNIFFTLVTVFIKLVYFDNKSSLNLNRPVAAGVLKSLRLHLQCSSWSKYFALVHECNECIRCDVKIFFVILEVQYDPEPV